MIITLLLKLIQKIVLLVFLIYKFIVKIIIFLFLKENII